ncbi:MAG: hypothetical protein WDM88_06475 [Galbitalea sp.]
MSETSKPALLYALSALIFLEGVGLAVGAIYLVVEIFVAPTASVATAVALAVCAAIGALGLGAIARAALNGRPWIRGATICVAVLQVLVAYSILIAKSPLVAWALIVPAVVMVVLLFTPRVLRATARPPREDQSGRN